MCVFHLFIIYLFILTQEEEESHIAVHFKYFAYNLGKLDGQYFCVSGYAHMKGTVPNSSTESPETGGEGWDVGELQRSSSLYHYAEDI